MGNRKQLAVRIACLGLGSALAAPFSLGADQKTAASGRTDTPSAFSFRPVVGLSYVHVEGNALSDNPTRAGWIAIHTEGDILLRETPRYEYGASANLLSSVGGMSQDAFDSSMTEAAIRGYMTFKFPTRTFGVVHARAELGYFGSWRFKTNNPDLFLSTIRGFQVRAKLSTSFDESIRWGRVGVVGGILPGPQSAVTAGAFISHRLSSDKTHPWDLAFAANIAAAREGARQETWTNFELGLSGAL